MKSHCAAGRDAIVTSARELGEGDGTFLGYAAEIAFCHHERWNGKGYPQQLAGDVIPVCARLMALADVYDALISKRLYKDAIPHDESLRMMVAKRGTHFDPVMIDAMVSISDHFDSIAQLYKDGADKSSSGERKR
jgi:putative two-component system response regulator